MKLLAFLILTIPTDWELFAERKGEAPAHKKRSATVRVVLMIFCSLVAMEILAIYDDISVWITYSKCLLLSFAIFLLVFDYAINLILGRKPWYKYLSKSPIDKAWSGWNWKWRMVVRIVIFISANIFYLWN